MVKARKMLPSAKQKGGKAKTKVRAVVPRGVGLSGQEAKYAKLLLDPCNAELVPPPYGGAAGSFQVRYTYSIANTLANGVYFWHPLWGLLVGENASSNTPIVLTAALGLPAGVVNIESGGRAVAGCHEVLWYGAESARAGYVACGSVSGSFVYNMLATSQGGPATPTGVSATTLTNMLQSQTRMPVDKCTLNFSPDTQDELFMGKVTFGTASQAFLANELPRYTFLAIVVSNAAATSVLIRQVGVLDVKPEQGSGFSSGGYGQSPPPGSWAKVVRMLASVDTQWYVDTFKKLAKFGGSAASAYATGGLPGALGYLVKEVPTMIGRPKTNFG